MAPSTQVGLRRVAGEKWTNVTVGRQWPGPTSAEIGVLASINIRTRPEDLFNRRFVFNHVIRRSCERAVSVTVV